VCTRALRIPSSYRSQRRRRGFFARVGSDIVRRFVQVRWGCLDIARYLEIDRF
jgi:hypothetical protein